MIATRIDPKTGEIGTEIEVSVHIVLRKRRRTKIGIETEIIGETEIEVTTSIFMYSFIDEIV